MGDWSPEMVRQLRERYGLTRKQLGDLTGVTITTIYLWEMGQRKPSRTAEILLSRIEQELKDRKLAEGQARKEMRTRRKGLKTLKG
jgi:DNA-binding transcriptional regulator YiaG